MFPPFFLAIKSHLPQYTHTITKIIPNSNPEFKKSKEKNPKTSAHLSHSSYSPPLLKQACF